MAEHHSAGLRSQAGVRSEAPGLPGATRAADAGFTAAEGRKFAFTVGLAFLVLGGILWWRDHDLIATVAATLAGALLLAGLIVPRRLEPVQRAWMGLARAISKVTNPVIMGLIYFLVITPVGLLRRTVGRNPLRHPDADGSYWIRRDGERGDLERQF